MNKFEREYIKIITEWNSNILLEANLKSLIPNIQQQLIGNKSYNDLTDDEKQELQNNINRQLKYLEIEIGFITDNKQYQSWIYNILKNKEVPLTDLKPISNIISDFNKLCKRPDLSSQQKNIQNYPTLKDLQNFIDQFKEEHKLISNIYKNLKQIYQNNEFTVYFINADQYDECEKLFGGTDYFSTGWCVSKNKTHFDNYINNRPDKYNGYFVFIKNNKPYALLHYGSYQFKDDSNKKLRTDNPNIIDCLYHIDSNINDYKEGDLEYYFKPLFLKKHPNPSKEDWIAFEIDGEYNKETKTIDCKGNKVRFKDEWLDDNGTFDFNFINATDDWSRMFYECKKLTKLPDNFVIPNDVTNCRCLFYDCFNLKELPDNFTIPDSVINCEGMFCECHRLRKLPNNFTISNNVINCNYMFENCINLTKLPDNFTIPNSVKECYAMFFGCEDLTKLPDIFTIPKNSKHAFIFDGSGLKDRYNVKDLLR